jgi:NADPH-dependent 2,4-dienoyl-CoA reductase/sulfur reductase-like enzyme/nitrite reductase/ring-hydroxylating ferredoxin subunit
MNEKPILVLGRLEDLPDGGMRAVEVGGIKILLIRQGGEVTAIGAECPHAGAPMEEGVLADGQVICPWHKAAFCTRTGALLDPPAVDDLPSYAIEIANGDIVLRQPEPLAPPTQPGFGQAQHFVILGAGAAGFSAAQELRKTGFAGAVTLISHEDALPYDRTLLSKYVLSGEPGGEKSPLQNQDFFETHKITRRFADITRLDADRKTIGLSNGQILPYDKALIATGSVVTPLPFPGGKLANVFQLRSQEDAAKILRVAEPGKHVVVIGASFIGMEVAAALTERGLNVTVAGNGSAPFERQLGAAVGNVWRKIHEEKSVKFRFGVEVERLAGEQAVNAVILKGGEALPADLVIAGLGVKPATGFAQALTLDSDQAFEVDAQLRVNEDLYAAGDVAAFPIYGSGEPIRVEHWRVAEQHSVIAARNMAGKPDRFISVPYFWTIQYMMRLDYVGHASAEDEQVIRGDLAERNFIAYYLRDGRVAAAAGMNTDKDMAAIIALMNLRQDWTVDSLHPAGSSPAEVLKTQTA